MTSIEENPRAEELETVLSDDLAEELADLASIWADLLLVEMSLHELGQLKEGSQIFARRALWEQAVIAYGRCFKTGRRRRVPDRSKPQTGNASGEVHARIIRWRDKHVAHRVDKELEWTVVSLVYPRGADVPGGVRIRVEVPMGPDDEGLIGGLAELARTMKNSVWEQSFPELEERLLMRYSSDVAARARASVFRDRQRPNAYTATIDPSGRSSSQGGEWSELGEEG